MLNDRDLIWAISSTTKFPSTEEKNRIISGLKWLGLLSDTPIIARGNPLDTLCATLEEKMQYGPGERDMCMLQHKFVIEDKDGKRVKNLRPRTDKKETVTSTLLEYGDPNGYSSMAKLVGVPCGVAAQQVLDGIISTPGILAPLNSKINGSLMETLKKEGIECKEEVVA